MPTTLASAYLEQTASQIYGYMLSDHTGNWGLDIHHWDWVPGVGVISALAYYESTQNPEILNHLTSWARQNMNKSEHLKVINSMAPFAIFPALYGHTKDPVFLETAERIGKWMLTEAPRTREGAFEHTVTENANFPEQVWADTIFMANLFLARLARLTGETAYAQEAVNQLDLHLRLLQDDNTGVLFHGWNCIAQDHMSSARWTRANAWIAVATPMILQEIEGLTHVPEETLERYRAMMQGLIRYQQPDGLWATVMDQPDYYPETSGSAGIACGILLAVKRGLLDPSSKEAAYRAVEAILSKILPTGEVTGVSGGSPVMPTIEAYNTIPCYPTLYGQGLVLMLLSELIVKKKELAM
ncbi:glycoside hydrolase family 88 protein [Paenibacillus alginolyticus]|uniref:glycoside hydrolase family 88/105 protein n=1 Tax=Paenibacillus alginolyticus TaxID=59839 RepID=UPI000419BA10|nr:glycoside hydrolase family 88 protein [Paenibacillus alginolyticus]MCY9667202.1 glycoside hydrolase family 88 protein [Paenibacillus alginolyticus]